jgi:hypothetical protein
MIAEAIPSPCSGPYSAKDPFLAFLSHTLPCGVRHSEEQGNVPKASSPDSSPEDEPHS